MRLDLIDVSGLGKGDQLGQAILEQVTETGSETKDYQLRLLRVAKWVEATLRAQERPATVVIRGAEIWILNDAEAASYNPNRHDRQMAGARRSHKRTLEIDRTQLSRREQQKLDQAIHKQAAILAAVQAAKRRARQGSTMQRA